MATQFDLPETGASQPQKGHTTANPGVWTIEDLEAEARRQGKPLQGGNVEAGDGLRKVDLGQIRVPTTVLRGDIDYHGTSQDQFNAGAAAAQNRGGPNTRIDFANSIAAANKGMGIGDQFASVANDPSKSAALQMFNQGLDRSMQSQMAAANAGRGGLQRAAAMRTAQNAGAQMKMQGNQQAASMMAQERMTNLGAAQNAYNQGAQLFGNQAIAQGQMTSEEAMKQRGLNDNLAMSSMAMGQKAADADYNARYAKSSTNAQLEHHANVSNAEIEKGAKVSDLNIAASDERVKKNVEDGHDEAREFLDALRAKVFEYMDTSLPGASEGRKLGVMAQDMERSKLGRNAVVEGDDGVKYIDQREAFAAALAGMADMNDRLKGIEHALSIRAKGRKD